MIIASIYAEPSPATPAGQSEVDLFDPRTGRLTLLYQPANQRMQAYGASGDGDWIVWSQDPNEDIVTPDWQLLAYNRHTGAVHIVAVHATAPDGRVPSSPFVTPSLLGGTVYWSAATADPPLGRHIATYSAALSPGSRPLEIRRDARDAHADSSVVVATTYDSSGPTPTGSMLTIMDTNGRSERPLPAAASPIYSAVSGAGVLWIVEHSAPSFPGGIDADVEISAPLGSPARTVYRGVPQFPAATDRVFAWQGYSDNALYAYDVATSQLVHLETGTAGAVFGSGRYLAWASGQTISVMDTSTILLVEARGTRSLCPLDRADPSIKRGMAVAHATAAMKPPLWERRNPRPTATAAMTPNQPR